MCGMSCQPISVAMKIQNEPIPEDNTECIIVDKSSSLNVCRLSAHSFPSISTSISRPGSSSPTTSTTRTSSTTTSTSHCIDYPNASQHRRNSTPPPATQDSTSPLRGNSIPPPATQDSATPLRGNSTPPEGQSNGDPVLSPSPQEGYSTHMRLRIPRTRRFYQEEFTYLMDAKDKGNVGRFINVSLLCEHNIFLFSLFSPLSS